MRSAFGVRVGIGLGIAVGYLAWIVLMVADIVSSGVNLDTLKARFYPSQTIDTSKETLEWLTDTDAARDRVPAARADLGEEVDRLEASARAAVDIPARIRRSPGEAAAAVGGVGFLALKGPQRLFGLARRQIRGDRPDLPSRMLPDEIEKTLRKLGDDGDKVRGVLERDFAEYARQNQKSRQGLASVVLLAAARPPRQGRQDGRRDAVLPGSGRCIGTARPGQGAGGPPAGARSPGRGPRGSRSPPRRRAASAPSACTACRRVATDRHLGPRGPGRRLELLRGRVAEWQTRRP
ncbi:MAG: hypothetical protein WKF78_13350 [Candidatus Limnocylindrales bacterium]